MKTRLRFLVLAGAVLFVTTTVKSQTNPAHVFVLSAAVDTGVPTGNAHNYSTFVLGGDIRLQYGLTDRFAVTFTTGGYHFFSKKMPGSEMRYSSYGVGPIKAGIKEFFLPNFYVGAEAGVGVEVTEQGFNGGQKKLLLSPALGYGNAHWDASIRYENYSGQNNSYGQVARRVGYGFRL